MLEREISLIADSEIAEGVRKIVKENEQFFNEYPTSVSGKYHKNEPTMKDHVARTVYFAKEFSREFNFSLAEKSIFVAACILHDIGNKDNAHKGNIPGMKYYHETGWSLDTTKDMKMHPTVGRDFIKQSGIKNAAEIAAIVETHMAHWYFGNRNPETFHEKLLALADYLASREEIIIKQGGSND
jgi:response regulator RpfG family c-di-GMP phosphodiesterase